MRLKLPVNDNPQHKFHKKEIAAELKNAFNSVSSFIEKHTSIVCPDCKNVCCIDKHGRYDDSDLVILRVLGIEKNHNDQSDHEETSPCRFLRKDGCSRQRWERPFRCTHFFCNPLLKSLENDRAKSYRIFIEQLQYLVEIRRKLLDIHL